MKLIVEIQNSNDLEVSGKKVGCALNIELKKVEEPTDNVEVRATAVEVALILNAYFEHMVERQNADLARALVNECDCSVCVAKRALMAQGRESVSLQPNPTKHRN